jgi:hypothetical protein
MWTCHRRETVAKARETALFGAGFKLELPNALDFGRTRNRLHIRSLRRSLRASAREATRDSSRDVRDGPDLFGGRPGAYQGPHRLRAVVPRSSVLVTDGQMRRLDSPRASPNRDAPVEPLGVGRALSPESVRASLEEDSWRSSTALLRKRAANPLTKPCKYWSDVPPARLRFQSLTLQEIGTGFG